MGECRRKSVKRALFSALCLLLCLFTAVPGLGDETLPAQEETRLSEQFAGRIAAGERLAVRVGGFQFRRLRTLTDKGKALVNRLLSDASVTLYISGDGSGFSLEKGNTVYIDFSQKTQGDTVITRVNGGELITGGPVIDTGYGETFGYISFLDDWPHLMARIARKARAYKKTSEKETDTFFSHVGSMKSRAVYELDGLQAGELLSYVLRLTGDFPPSPVTRDYLAQIVFAEKVTFTVYKDRSGTPVAFELSGDVTYMEKPRTFKMYLAANSGGLTFSLASKAKSGNDSCKHTLWMERKISGQTVTCTGGEDLTWRLGSEKTVTGMTFSLTDKMKNGTETISGTIRRTETKDGKETSLTVKPDLKYTGGTGSGSVDVVHRTGETIDISADLSVTFGFEREPGREEASLVFANGADVYAELLRSFARLMSGEPQEDRMLLAHELRTADWMAMGPVLTEAPAEENDADSFFVR